MSDKSHHHHHHQHLPLSCVTLPEWYCGSSSGQHLFEKLVPSEVLDHLDHLDHLDANGRGRLAGNEVNPSSAFARSASAWLLSRSPDSTCGW